MEVSQYASNLVSSQLVPSYSQDYVGGVKLLEDTGFSPFSENGPINSTLNQIFDRFVQKTGFNLDREELKSEFIEKNPSTKRAINLYGALENIFSSNSNSENPAIIEFLDSKIDESIAEFDQNGDELLTQEESELEGTTFGTIDRNRDAEINTDEIKNNFYGNFSQLEKILNFFKNNPGSLVDMYV